MKELRTITRKECLLYLLMTLTLELFYPTVMPYLARADSLLIAAKENYKQHGICA